SAACNAHPDPARTCSEPSSCIAHPAPSTATAGELPICRLTARPILPPAPSWKETVPSCLPAFSFEGSTRTVTRAGVLPLVFGSTIQLALALAVQACAPP